MISAYKTLTRAHFTQKFGPEEPLILEIDENIKNNKYNFSNNKYAKHSGRTVTYFNRYSAENVILIHLKYAIEKEFNIKFSNRNKIIDSLFDSLHIAQSLNDFTMIKFDFKQYFYTISTEYIFEHYFKNCGMSRADKDYVLDYCTANKYCVAGLPIVNYFVEIISREVDERIKSTFEKNGLFFYERYIDDGLIILNEFVDKSKVRKMIEDIIGEVFNKSDIKVAHKNKVRLNNKKFKVISKRYLKNPISIDFLGYDFTLTQDFKNITFGLTRSKINKYQSKINHLIKNSYDPANKIKSIELLRHMIKAHSSRVVYCSKTKKNKNLWISKGILTNYNQLKNYEDKIDVKTKLFLENIYFDAFLNAGIPVPNYLNQPRYSLLNNMKNNTALIFDDLIGANKEKLLKDLRKLNNFNRDEKSDYHSIVKEYLVTVRVGY